LGYPAWLGIRQLLNGRLIFVLYFVYPFLDSGMPAFAEALGVGKLQLARYYVVRYLQWGHWFAAIVIAFLVGAGRPLALHALSAEWQPVATYLPLAAGIAILLPSAWLADSFQNGSGRTGLNALLLLIEQISRVGLMWLLVPRLGFAGIFVALGITLTVKSLLGWWANHRFILRLELDAWTSIGAPLVTGSIWLSLLYGVARVLPPTALASMVLFGAGGLATFPLGIFLFGAVGGLDAHALDELTRAAELTSLMRPVARLLSRCARLGSRLGFRPPERDRVSMRLAHAAEREIDELVASVAELHDHR
jgi:O-antigen/teichoic acid export membrane protein